MDGICFLWPVPPSAPTAGAVRLVAFSHAALNLGLEVTTIVPAEAKDVTDEVEEGRVLHLPLYATYVDKRGFLKALLMLPSSTFRLARAIRDSRARGVVASTPDVFAAFQGLVACKLLGLPYILDVRDSWEMETFSHKGRIRNVVKERIERLCARSADRVMCVTSTLAARIHKRHGLQPESVDVVPNGADLGLFRPSGGARTLDLVFAGPPSEYHNVEGILASLAKLLRLRPQTTTLLLGWADTPRTADIRRMARDLGIARMVDVAPAIPHKDVPEALARARLGIDAFVDVDPYRMGLSVKDFEYMACGVPVACLGPEGQSELRTLIEGNEVGFFATTPDDFAEQANEILSDDVARARMARNCVATSARFDRREIAERALTESVLPFLRMSQRGSADRRSLPAER